MRILFISGEYPPQPGGVGDYTMRLAQEITTDSNTIETLSYQNSSYTLYSTRGEPQQIAKPRPRRPWGWELADLVRQLVREKRYDLVHIQYQTGAYAMRPAINLLPRQLRKTVPVVVTFHDLLVPYLFPKAGPLRKLINREMARQARLVIATNPSDQRRLGRWGAPARLIPIGSNIEPISVTSEQANVWRQRAKAVDAPLIGFFGLLSPLKGLDVLLAAVAAQPTWHVLVIGGAATAPQDRQYAEQIKQQINQLNLHSRVLISGHLEPAAVSAALKACDMIALPFADGASFSRGSLLAALAHGRPLITTTPADEQTAAELRDQIEVLLVPPRDPRALGSAITRLLDQREFAASLAERGMTIATSRSWSQISGLHVAAYRSLL